MTPPTLAQAKVDGRSSLAEQVLQRAADDGDYAQATRIHHPCFLKYRELVGSAGEGFNGAGVSHLPQCDYVALAGVVGLHRGVRGSANYGQHCALAGLADGPVRGVGCRTKRGHSVG